LAAGCSFICGRSKSSVTGRFKVSDATGVVSAAIAAAALLVAYFAYRRQRNKTGLEYVILGNTRVVPRATPTDLEVTYKGATGPDASVVVVRIVNTGDKAILSEDFHSPLVQARVSP
jgi:hypothetical protein